MSATSLPQRVHAYFAAERYGRLASLLAFVAAFALLLTLLPAQGLTDDDDFYAPAGIRYAGWLGDLVTGPSDALSQTKIDRAFKINHEHPPFAKYVIGVAHAVTHKAMGLMGSLDGARSGVAFLAALLVAILLRLAWRPFGPAAAVFAALATLALPRFFFHSQVATLDVPVATMLVATVAAFFWAERDRRWALWAGVIFGLALLTKLNAPFAAIPCTLYAILCRWRGFGVDREPVASLRIPPLPRSLVAMLFLGPLMFVALWPWLWFDTFMRIGKYFAFHLGHYPIYLFYEGEIYTKPFAPWHMPFTMTAMVTPLPTLFLGVVGGLLGGRALIRLFRRADTTGEVPTVSQRDKLLALVLLQAAFAIGIVAFSNVPKYGGAKLFMPFFPLLALLAGAGFARAMRALFRLVPGANPQHWWLRPLDDNHAVARTTSESRATLSTEAPSLAKATPALVAVLLVLTLVPGVVASVKTFGGFGLSAFSAATGGIRGATARGYERTYYDIADKELARWLDANANGRRVHFEPNHKEYARTYRWLAKDGVISRNLRLTKRKDDAELLVLTHERRWSTYPRLLREHRKFKKVYEKRIDNVPLYTVYERR